MKLSQVTLNITGTNLVTKFVIHKLMTSNTHVSVVDAEKTSHKIFKLSLKRKEFVTLFEILEFIINLSFKTLLSAAASVLTQRNTLISQPY